MLPFQKISREVIVKHRSETSPKFGKRPEERTVAELIDSGIINVDKPAGPSSHQVSAYAQQILKIKKAGHSGTLDPAVTGVLPVALGKATKIVQMLLPAGKEYIAIMHLHADIHEHSARAAIAQFVGKITQLPPVRSAVKRQLRERTIYYADVLEIDGRDVLMRVGCEAGTYIRKLCTDIGKQLGCGAHMLELRRTRAGPFDESTVTMLQDVRDAFHYYTERGEERFLKKLIMPIEAGADHLAKVWVMDTTVDSLTHGATLNLPGIASFHSGIMPGDLIAIMTLKDEIVAYGKAQMSSDEMARNEKGAVVKPLRVFMDVGIYPKMERHG